MDDTKRTYAFGDLNPFEIKKSQRFFDPHNSDPLHAMREAALENMAGDALANTGPYVGVVLRVENEMNTTAPPAESWLAAFFGEGARLNEGEEPLEAMPSPLAQYKVRIPEIHSMLPDPDEYVPASQKSPWHKLINMYPTFISMDSEALPAKEGDLVWVDYKDKVNFEDPYYIKPVFAEPQPGSTGAGNAAADAFNCNSKSGSRRTGKGGPGGGGTTGPSGGGLEYLSENAKEALKKSGETYQKFPNSMYAALSVQKKNCKADPMHMRLEGVDKISELDGYGDARCVNCWGSSPFPVVGSRWTPDQAHAYREGFVAYVANGGRGAAKSGKLGLNCTAHLNSRLSKMMLGHRLACEDQAARGYSWGGKTYDWNKCGIDCSGFSFMVRVLTEVMISTDGNFDGFGNQRFKGDTRMGMGTDKATAKTSNTFPGIEDSNLEIPWSMAEYGSGPRKAWRKDIKKRKRKGQLYCKSKYSCYGNYTSATVQKWRAGLYHNVHGLEDANEPYKHGTHAPLMPGDQLLCCGGSSHRATNKKGFGTRHSGKMDFRHDNGISHVVTAFCGADGQLYIGESGGSFSGVGATPVDVYFEKKHRMVHWAWEMEEWHRAWTEHPDGRPTEKWTPEMAKKYCPDVFGDPPANLDEQATGDKEKTEGENNPGTDAVDAETQKANPPEEGTKPAEGETQIEPKPEGDKEEETDSTDTKKAAEEKEKAEKCAAENKQKLETEREHLVKIQRGLGKIVDAPGLFTGDKVAPFDDTTEAKGEMFELRKGFQAPDPIDSEQTKDTWLMPTEEDGDNFETGETKLPITKEDVIRVGEEEGWFTDTPMYLASPKYLGENTQDEKEKIGETTQIRKALIDQYATRIKNIDDKLKEIEKECKDEEKDDKDKDQEASSGAPASAPCKPGGGGGNSSRGGGGGADASPNNNRRKPDPNTTADASTGSATMDYSQVQYLGEDIATSEPRAKLVRIDFDEIRYDFPTGKGGTSAKLREDAAHNMLKAKEVVNNLGGIICHIGTLRNVSKPCTSQNCSSTSFHYTGMALDLYTHAGSIYSKADVDKCEYIIEYDNNEVSSKGDPYFIVWARSDKPGAEFGGFKVEQRTLSAVKTRSGRPPGIIEVTGYFMNLTAILAAYGYKRVNGRKTFYTKSGPGASEWWHFETHIGLSARSTSYGSVMEKIYTVDKLSGTPPYEHKQSRWSGRGFPKVK